MARSPGVQEDALLLRPAATLTRHATAPGAALRRPPAALGQPQCRPNRRPGCRCSTPWHPQGSRGGPRVGRFGGADERGRKRKEEGRGKDIRNAEETIARGKALPHHTIPHHPRTPPPSFLPPRTSQMIAAMANSSMAISSAGRWWLQSQ